MCIFHKWTKSAIGGSTKNYAAIFNTSWDRKEVLIIKRCKKCNKIKCYVIDIHGKKTKISYDYLLGVKDETNL